VPYMDRGYEGRLSEELPKNGDRECAITGRRLKGRKLEGTDGEYPTRLNLG